MELTSGNRPGPVAGRIVRKFAIDVSPDRCMAPLVNRLKGMPRARP
jgi:hypothetical protein